MNLIKNLIELNCNDSSPPPFLSRHPSPSRLLLSIPAFQEPPKSNIEQSSNPSSFPINSFQPVYPLTTFPVQLRTHNLILPLFLTSPSSPAEDKYSTSHSSPSSAFSALPHISLHKFLLNFAIRMRPSKKLNRLFRDIDHFGGCGLRRSRRVWV